MKLSEIAPIVLVFLCAFAVFLCGYLIGGATVPQPQENTVEIIYPATMVVTDTDFVFDTVTLEDSTGNLWAFHGVEDWQVGDCASVILSTNNTAEIKDDIILHVRYSTWDLKGD